MQQKLIFECDSIEELENCTFYSKNKNVFAFLDGLGTAYRVKPRVQ